MVLFRKNRSKNALVTSPYDRFSQRRRLTLIDQMVEQKPMRENVTDVEFRNNFLFQFLKYRSLLLLKLNMKLNNIY